MVVYSGNHLECKSRRVLLVVIFKVKIYKIFKLLIVLRVRVYRYRHQTCVRNVTTTKITVG